MPTAPKPPSTPDTFDPYRSVGPLPLWAWIVVVLAAFLYWRRRTEPGWFPGASYPAFGGGAGTGEGSGGFDGVVDSRRAPEESTAEEEPPLTVEFVGSGDVGRPTLPSPIITGGPDGSVYSTATPSRSRTGLTQVDAASATRSGKLYAGSQFVNFGTKKGK